MASGGAQLDPPGTLFLTFITDPGYPAHPPGAVLHTGKSSTAYPSCCLATCSSWLARWHLLVPGGQVALPLSTHPAAAAGPVALPPAPGLLCFKRPAWMQIDFALLLKTCAPAAQPCRRQQHHNETLFESMGEDSLWLKFPLPDVRRRGACGPAASVLLRCLPPIAAAAAACCVLLCIITAPHCTCCRRHLQ